MAVESAGTAEETKQTISIDISEDYFGSGETSSAKDMRLEIEQNIDKLVVGKNMGAEEKAKLAQKLHKPLGRNVFASILEKFTRPTSFESWECFLTFAELVNTFLTEFANEKDYNYKALQIVLQIGKSVFTKVGNVI